MSEVQPEIKDKHRNMKCSVCSSEINKNYYSQCGQYCKNKRINFTTFLGDLFNGVFSLEKSFFEMFESD